MIQLDFTLPSDADGRTSSSRVPRLQTNVQHWTPSRRSAGMYIVRLHFSGRHKHRPSNSLQDISVFVDSAQNFKCWTLLFSSQLANFPPTEASNVRSIKSPVQELPCNSAGHWTSYTHHLCVTNSIFTDLGKPQGFLTS